MSLDELKNGFELTEEENNNWEIFKYTVCLNAAYYKFMQDSDLKEKLLATGDNTLVYESDDEWGGDVNLFGFTLMELRDEIHRLCDNEDLIDWEYTEYLKNAYPYVNHRDPNDEQSAEYRVVESVITNSSRYVRDVNLDSDLAVKYQKGQILTEKGFVDATDKIGGMLTTHRYMILSSYMADFSKMEKDTNWGLHVAKRGSKFKVIDICEVDGKTQIALVQLPDGFEGVFENTLTIENEIVEELRDEFEEILKLDAIPEVNTPEWYLRCNFPIGMNDDGEFF